MTRTRNMSDLLDSSGDVKSGALDNVPASDVVNDTTPQLGGDLSTNGNDVNFGDNDKAIFGAGSDLQIYHDGGHSRISDLGTGRLTIETNGDSVRLTKGTTENMLIATPDGSVDLYYNNAKKLATTSTGVSVTGDLSVSGSIAGAGKVLQVVQTVISGVISLSTATGSWQNIPSLTATITPSSTSSKILVRVNVQVGHNSMGNMTTRLRRGSTTVGVGTAVSGALQGSFGLANRAESSVEVVNKTFEFMDSPSTTSATTYSLQNYNNWNTNQCYLGRTYNSLSSADDGTYPSVITLMEISA